MITKIITWMREQLFPRDSICRMCGEPALGERPGFCDEHAIEQLASM
jgi:hypothetical protein